MKKQYTKPVIIFEDFSLSTSVSAGCEEQPENSMDFNSCGIIFGEDIIFVSGLNGCKVQVVEGSASADGTCYHNPSDEKNIFTS